MTLSDSEAVPLDWADDTAPFCIDEEPDIDPHDLDALIANELTRLSITDRERWLCEIHGVPSKIIETPQMIEESLRQLQNEVDAIPRKLAYEKARNLNPSYVHDARFLLKFLRAERFDHAAAARRLVQFFEVKLELFGESLLATNITQEHLDKDDIDALHQGMGMDLPFRDRAGRVVFFQLSQPVNFPLHAILRKSLYTLLCLSDDEETQKNGVVVVSYIVGQELTWQRMRQRREMNRQWATLVHTVPIRIEVLHACIDSILWRPLLAVFKLACNMLTRIRIREHIGDHRQVIASLQALGIPTHGFPVTDDGTILRHLCVDRWKKRQAQEQMMKQQAEQPSQEQGDNSKQQKLHLKRVENPGQNDVLLGRGKLYYCHPGNRRLKRIVMEQIGLYEEAGYAEKYRVSADVVKFIKSMSGRFLREDDNGWVEVDDDAAIKKVSHGFRTLRGMFKNSNAKPSTKAQMSSGKTKFKGP